MQRFVERLWYSQGAAYRLARLLLVPLSWLFALLAAARGRLYDCGLLTVHRIGVPVVSVGNLSVGGTGKTPMVIWLVERLREQGRDAVVVSRGYGGRSQRPQVVSTAGWADADEALLVAARCGCGVVTGADRVSAARLAERSLTPDIVILDDGFQHRRLWRDLDIVMVGRDDRSARLLPAGPLRESPRRLARADVVIADGGAPNAPRLLRRASGLVDRVGSEPRPLSELDGCRVVAVAAIARPERFFAMLEEAGATLTATLSFRDHHRYTAADWRRIQRVVGGLDGQPPADLVVTTEKDLVKLAPLATAEERLVALRLDIEVLGAAELLERIAQLGTT